MAYKVASQGSASRATSTQHNNTTGRFFLLRLGRGNEVDQDGQEVFGLLGHLEGRSYPSHLPAKVASAAAGRPPGHRDGDGCVDMAVLERHPMTKLGDGASTRLRGDDRFQTRAANARAREQQCRMHGRGVLKSMFLGWLARGQGVTLSRTAAAAAAATVLLTINALRWREARPREPWWYMTNSRRHLASRFQ